MKRADKRTIGLQARIAVLEEQLRIHHEIDKERDEGRPGNRIVRTHCYHCGINLA